MKSDLVFLRCRQTRLYFIALSFTCLTFHLWPSVAFAQNTETQDNLELRQNSEPSDTTTIPAYHFQFSRIPEHAWGDVKEIFWGTNGVVLIATIGGSLAFLAVDQDVKDHFAAHSLFSQKFDDNIGLIFSPYIVGGASLGAFLLSTQLADNRLSLATESLVESWIGSMGIIGATKLGVNRNRPDGKALGLPSAHAGAAFSTASVLTEFYGWPAAVPAYLLASLVTYCRLDGHNHYLTDVLIGSVIGTAFGIGTSEFHKKEFDHFMVTPLLSRSNFGVGLRKTF